MSSEKIGTVAWAIAAGPESMCCSPQATSQKGSAALSRPSTSDSRQAVRRRLTAVAGPSVTPR